jgi:hypothetical protein
MRIVPVGVLILATACGSGFTVPTRDGGTSVDGGSNVDGATSTDGAVVRDSAPPDATLTCMGLSQSACQAASPQGCTVVLCPTCTGTQNYAGCADPGHTIACPGINCQPTCHKPADCPTLSERCVEPGDFIGCGACQIPLASCTSDGMCVSGPDSPMICDVAPCTCNGAKTCIAGCKGPSDCKAGQICGLDHRCEAMPCGGPTDCPPQFTCGATGDCARKTCSTDPECPGGYCVNGGCYAQLGMCQFPVP